jgi:hypothetical protein
VAPLSDCVTRGRYFLKATLAMLLMTENPPTVEVTHLGTVGGGGSAAQMLGCSTAGIAKRTW